MRLLKDAKGEPRIWSHTVNYAIRDGGRYNKGWWLNLPGGYLHTQTILFQRSNRLRLCFSLGGGDSDNEVQLSIGLPWLFAFHLVVAHRSFSRFMPYKWSKNHRTDELWKMPVQREIGVAYHHDALWITLWSDPIRGPNRRWQIVRLNLMDTLFGRPKYRQTEGKMTTGYIDFPEGFYKMTAREYTAVWKRPRWPRLHRKVARVDLEIPGGIPIPGKGENGWDMEDTAVDSVTGNYKTAWAAKKSLWKDVMLRRNNDGGVSWEPDEGWPEHRIPPL